MKNLLVVRDTLDQILIVDTSESMICKNIRSNHYDEVYFGGSGKACHYLDRDLVKVDQPEAARLISEWASVSRNQNFVNPDVTAFEICTEETRYRVTRDMPDWIVCYVDYIDPLKDREPKPVQMQYINRRISDGALWPTFCPITSEGWEQIGTYPIEGRHEVGDTVLFFDRYPKPADKMERHPVKDINKEEGRIYAQGYSMRQESLINFSKGDHLTAQEREAWNEEASGHQESYYSSFKNNAQ